MAEDLPNFLIVGAAKSGTTSLFRYLDAQPEVFFPPNKEPTFFIDAAHRHTNWSTYLDLFKDSGRYPARGEASVAYLYDKSSPELIGRALTDPRIIMILRSPIETAFSLWGQMRVLRREPMDFEAALDAESRRFEDTSFWHTAKTWPPNLFYTRRAKYFEQVSRYLDAFGSDRVLILVFEEFFENAHDAIEEVYDFLDLTERRPVDFAVHNPWNDYRSERLRALFNESYRGKELLKTLVPMRLRTAAKTLANRLNLRAEERPELSASLRIRLMDVFRDDVRQLEQLLQRPLLELWGFSGSGGDR